MIQHHLTQSWQELLCNGGIVGRLVALPSASRTAVPLPLAHPLTHSLTRPLTHSLARPSTSLPPDACPPLGAQPWVVRDILVMEDVTASDEAIRLLGFTEGVVLLVRQEANEPTVRLLD